MLSISEPSSTRSKPYIARANRVKPPKQGKPKAQFGAWIKIQMTNKGITQYELAADLGTPQCSVSWWVNGKHWPTGRLRYAICLYFGASKKVTDYWMQF